MPATAKRDLRRAHITEGWKRVLPYELCVDILRSQGYTHKAALRELSSLGRSP